MLKLHLIDFVKWPAFLNYLEFSSFVKNMILKNFLKRLNMRFQVTKLKYEFLKKDFHFLQSSKSFQVQGHFGAFYVNFGMM